MSTMTAECLWCDRDCPRCRFPIDAGWEHVEQPQPAGSNLKVCHLRRVVVRPLADVLVGFLHHRHSTAAQVAPPVACLTCDGARQVTLAADPGVLWPCPTCCCHVCSRPTDTPPECGTCANRDEAQAKRRADR